MGSTLRSPGVGSTRIRACNCQLQREADVHYLQALDGLEEERETAVASQAQACAKNDGLTEISWNRLSARTPLRRISAPFAARIRCSSERLVSVQLRLSLPVHSPPAFLRQHPERSSVRTANHSRSRSLPWTETSPQPAPATHSCLRSCVSGSR